jgi:dipeptidyl aminopeptidase/acylaminoacyl peptidase
MAFAMAARADSVDEARLELLFRPLVGERLAMSTDGHYVAFSQHDKTDLLVIVYDLEKMRLKTRIIADEDRPILFSKEKERTKLRFLDWANGNRLVFAPTIEVVPPPISPLSGEFLQSASPEVRAMIAAIPKLNTRYIAPVMAVDADGGRPINLQKKVFENLLAGIDPAVDPRVVVPTLRGFDTGKFRDQLLVEFKGGGSGLPTELIRVNVDQGGHTVLHREFRAGPFIYDWAGEPRLNPFTPRRSSITTFDYHAPGAKHWMPMPEPPDEDAGAHFTVRPENYFGSRVIALGFDFDPNVLLYASNVGRDTFGIYGMDLRTRRRTDLVLEVPHRDLVALDTTAATSPLVFDPFRQKLVGVHTDFGPRPLTVWRDPGLKEVQHAVEKRFLQRSVVIEQWNEARTRFLVRTTGGTDPGSIFLVRRPEGSMTELTRSAPWLAEKDLHETQFFEFTAANGAQLTGYLTLPRAPRINPPPLVVWFAPGIPPQPHPAFDPQAQVLADMGFVVCRLNQRGMLGLGAVHREALRRDLDHVPAEDAVAAIEWVAQHHRIDRKRVVALGEGFAGHLAVRATQLHPEAFRCAVLFDPILDFSPLVQMPPNVDGAEVPTFQMQVNRLFLEGSGKKIHELSVLSHPDELNAAVFIATPMVGDPSIAGGVSALRRLLRRRDIVCVQVDYNRDFVLGLPGARARVYRALEEFINLNLYHYDVKIGPTKVVR